MLTSRLQSIYSRLLGVIPSVAGLSRVAESVTMGTTIDLTSLGVQAGDLIVVAFSRASNTTRPPTVTSTGYSTAAAVFSNSSADTSFYVYYKIMDTVPDDSFVHTNISGSTDGNFTTLEVWRGADVSNPMDVSPVTAQGTNTRLVNPGAITPITAGSKILVIGASSTSNISADALSMSYGSSQFPYSANKSAYKVDGNRAYVDWTGGTYDPAAFTCTNNQTGDSWASVTIALRPAS
jgi:hypothetical protein